MGNSLSLDLMEYIPGHLALLYHVDRMPELTSSPDIISTAIKRFVHFSLLCSSCSYILLHIFLASFSASSFTSSTSLLLPLLFSSSSCISSSTFSSTSLSLQIKQKEKKTLYSPPFYSFLLFLFFFVHRNLI